MLGSPVLDLAIGMAFIYLLLSLVASVFQEMIATITQARAANLERGLHSLFSGDALSLDKVEGRAKTFVEALYQHGLIRGLYKDHSKDSAQTGDAPRRPVRTFLRRLTGMTSPDSVQLYDHFLLPAYIPARTFALALTDLLGSQAGGSNTLQGIKSHLLALQKAPVTTNDGGTTAVAAVSAGTGSMAAGETAAAADPLRLENKAAEALLALLGDAGYKADKFKTNIENWYNDSMDRASGWYKRYVQRILTVIGFVIAVSLNVDSIHVAQTLWFDHDARQGLANAATQYIQTHPNFADTQSGTRAPDKDRAASSAGSAKDPASFSPEELKERLEQTVDSFNDVSQKTMLPVGWQHRPGYALPPNAATGNKLLAWLLAVVGWCITAGALSFGAPFWFDMLNKIMVIRGTVKPSEKSPNEASKS